MSHCPHRLNEGPLTCVRTSAHDPDSDAGHVYAASDCTDRHALTEPNGREA